jgi:hypothetical protein
MADVISPPALNAAITRDKEDAAKTMVLTSVWSRWFTDLAKIVNAPLGGATATVPLAKLTSGGVNGSLTFTDGILTSYVSPT